MNMLAEGLPMSVKPSIENPLLAEYFHALLAAAAADPRHFPIPADGDIALGIRLTDADRLWRLRFSAGCLAFDEAIDGGTDEVVFLLTRQELAEILSARAVPGDTFLAARTGGGDAAQILPSARALAVLLTALAAPMARTEASLFPVADHEETIQIPASGDTVEAHLSHADGADGSRLLVVFPAHPLFGEDAADPVIRAMIRSGVESGYVSVRCNYRGVTACGFRDDDAHRTWLDWEARRDYTAVRDDAAAILDEVRRRVPHAETFVLAGYSFGAAAALMTLARLAIPVRQVVLVSPPLGAHDFDALIAGASPVPLQILAPTLDPSCSVADLASLAARHGASLRLLPVEEHFFRGAEVLIRNALKEWMAW
jgi:hypothetical protein